MPQSHEVAAVAVWRQHALLCAHITLPLLRAEALGGSIGAYHACHMSGAYGRKSIDASVVYMNKVSARPEGMTGQRAELRAVYRRPWAKDAQPPSPLSTHLVHSLNGKKGEAASAPVTGTKDPYSGEAPKDMPFRRHS